MLTVELLKQNPALAGLTDEQLTAIATMSTNDENQVVGAKIGEIHGGYDKDILEATGLAKQDSEKSYDYMKRAFSVLKEKAENPEVKKQLEAANAKVASLEEQIRNNTGDAVLKQQLQDAKNQVAKLQEAAEVTKADMAKVKADYEGQIQGIKIDNAFDKATSSLKIKSSIPQSLHAALIAQAKAEVMGKGKPEFDAKGNLIFRGADGQILSDPSNGMEPYQLSSLLMTTSLKDAIDNGRQQTGGGTGGGKGDDGKGGSGEAIDLSGCRTRGEATEAISKYLLGKGLTVDSDEYQTKSLEMYKENNVSEMPMN